MLLMALDELEAGLTKTCCWLVLDTHDTDLRQKDLMRHHLRGPSNLQRIRLSNAILILRPDMKINGKVADAHWRSEARKLRLGWKFGTARQLHQ